MEPERVSVHATTFSDAQEIGDAYAAGMLVDVLFDDEPGEFARRVIDFSSGVAYATRGSFRRVDNGHYLLSPGSSSPENPDVPA